MGQCSTLPTAEARQEQQTDNNSAITATTASTRQSRHGIEIEPYQSSGARRGRQNTQHPTQGSNGFLQNTVPQKDAISMPMDGYSGNRMDPMQTTASRRKLQRPDPSSSLPEPMELETEPTPPRDQPPSSAIRTRCYKLNLESDYVGLEISTTVSVSTATRGGIDSLSLQSPSFLGPFAQDGPPDLTYTSSDDSSTVGANPVNVAIQTAQIFRGITISKDGTILAQNARASRSNRTATNAKNKKGEKSRQAAKIDKAKDLVEESILSGKAPDSDEPVNLVSLVIMGEYDDMKQLVRDGSKKLRDSNGLPDEALLAINRNRKPDSIPLRPSSITASLLSPRNSLASGYNKTRVSPHYVAGQRNAAAMASQLKSSSSLAAGATPVSSPSAAGATRNTPPKLNSHPRDRPSSRRMSSGLSGTDGDNKSTSSRRSYIQGHDPCHDMLPGGHGPASHMGVGDSDWSHALGLSRGFHSIWNCGGMDNNVNGSNNNNNNNNNAILTTNPTPGTNPNQPIKSTSHVPVVTPQQPQSPIYEGRDTNHNRFRDGGMMARAS